MAICWVRPLLRLAAWGLALIALACPSTAGPNDLVLIITNEDYRGGVPKVEFARRDGEAFMKAMRELAGVPTSRVIHIGGPSGASRGDFQDYFGADNRRLAELAAAVRPDTNVYLFYSGHGLASTNPATGEAALFLIPVDGDTASPADRGNALPDIEAALSSVLTKRGSSGRVFLFLDTCFGGTSAGGAVAKDTRMVGDVVESVKAKPAPRVVRFAAATGKQLARWDTAEKHGLFTDALIEALYTLSRSKQKMVRAGTLQTLIDAHVERRLAQLYPGQPLLQTPTLIGDREAIVASLSGSGNRDPVREAEEARRCRSLALSGDADEIDTFLGSCRTCTETCKGEIAKRAFVVGQQSVACRVDGAELKRLAGRPAVNRAAIEDLAKGTPCAEVRGEAEAVLAGLDAGAQKKADPVPDADKQAAPGKKGEEPQKGLLGVLKGLVLTPPKRVEPDAAPQKWSAPQKVALPSRIDANTQIMIEPCGFLLGHAGDGRQVGQARTATVIVGEQLIAVQGAQTIRVNTERAQCMIAVSVGPGGSDLYITGECQCRTEASGLKAPTPVPQQRLNPAPKIAAIEPPGPAVGSDIAISVAPGSGKSFRDKLANGTDCAFCPEMVVVPAGSFVMGMSPSEPDRIDSDAAQRTVTIRHPLAVGKFELTFDEWGACVSAGGCSHRPDDSGWGRGRRPVINVSWEDAQQYVAWLSKATGKTYRLLTEAEWEYAARAGTTTRYSFGDTITKQQAQYSEETTSSAGNTVVVGSFPANGWGLHDMHGNVWEWVEDCWHDSYGGAPMDGRAWTTGCSEGSRVLRGGSWGDLPRGLRSATRFRILPAGRFDLIGFRLARTLSPAP